MQEPGGKLWISCWHHHGDQEKGLSRGGRCDPQTDQLRRKEEAVQGAVIHRGS